MPADPPDGPERDERPTAEGPTRWKASSTAAGERLDVYLARVFETSRSRAARWIEAGRVTVGKRPPKAGLKLEGGEWLSCEPEQVSQEGRVEPEEGPLDVLHEDEALVVLDKPAELVVHPGAGRPAGTLANRLLATYPEMSEVGGPGRPGIVHRLDLGTSGVLVAARTGAAHRTLTEAFAQRQVTKTYLAIGHGRPKEDAGSITAAIARNPRNRKEMAVAPGGRPAETGYRALAHSNGLTFFELSPLTGRTHQIRVHLKWAGHPIVGDPVYGEARWKELPRPVQPLVRDFPRTALHAWRLAFDHPVSGEACSFTAPLPVDLSDLWTGATGSALPTV